MSRGLQWVRAKARRLLPLMIAFGLITSGVAAVTVVTSPPAFATGTYNNGDIATDALADVGDNPAPGGGQCKAFANAIVHEASGGTQSPSGYQSGWAALGTEVSSADATRGDIIQITPAGSTDGTVDSIYAANMNPDGTSPPAYRLHTTIIVSNNGNDSFSVVDANFTSPYTVGTHTFDPYTWAAGSIVKIWRLGTVSGGGSSGYDIAFPINNGDLGAYSSSGDGTNTGQGMASGTSPSIADVAGDYDTAFQQTNGYLNVYDSNAHGGTNTELGMASGTSPSITALAGGGYEVAFEDNAGNLYVYGNGGTYDTGLGELSGTSPSIIATSGEHCKVAFQQNNGYLNVYDSVSGGGGYDTGLVMDYSSSPSMTQLPSGGYEVAFTDHSDDLYMYGTSGTYDTDQGAMAATSPSITQVSSGGYETAFQLNSGYLGLYAASAPGSTNTEQGMKSGTSPSIMEDGSGYTVAFQINNGYLGIYDSVTLEDSTGQGMEAGGSPSISLGRGNPLPPIAGT
jgi:hypothetical protein